MDARLTTSQVYFEENVSAISRWVDFFYKKLLYKKLPAWRAYFFPISLLLFLQKLTYSPGKGEERPEY